MLARPALSANFVSVQFLLALRFQVLALTFCRDAFFFHMRLFPPGPYHFGINRSGFAWLKALFQSKPPTYHSTPESFNPYPFRYVISPAPVAPPSPLSIMAKLVGKYEPLALLAVIAAIGSAWSLYLSLRAMLLAWDAMMVWRGAQRRSGPVNLIEQFPDSRLSVTAARPISSSALLGHVAGPIFWVIEGKRSRHCVHMIFPPNSLH